MSTTELVERCLARIEELERRVIELEIEAAFRRKAQDDLDEVVRTQDQRIDALERRLGELLTTVTPIED